MNGDNAEILAGFFREMAENPALYNDYLTNPLKTMRDRKIPEDLIGAVLQGDLHRLNKLFADADTAVILGTLIRW
jgi:hypothetical protein